MSLVYRIYTFPMNLYLRLRYYFTWWILQYNAVEHNVHVFVAERFRQYGFFAARHPYSLILFSVAVFLVTSYPLAEISFTEYPPLEFVESTLSALPTPTWFHGPTGSVAVLLPLNVSLTLQPRIANRTKGSGSEGLAYTCSPIRTVALAADRLVSALNKASSLPKAYKDICFRIQGENSTGLHPSFLPEVGECFVTAPVSSIGSYSQMIKLFDDPSSLQNNYSLSDLGLDITFGVPFGTSGLPELYQTTVNHKHMCASAVGRSISWTSFVFFLSSFHGTPSVDSLISALQPQMPKLHAELLHALSESETLDESAFASEYPSTADRPVYLYFRSWNWMEFMPIFAIYSALLGYIYFSLSKIAMVKSKVGLAFGAVFGIGASFLVVLGICTRLGLTFDYFFSATDIFPYITVLNGLENIVIMTTAVTTCRREYKLDVPHCIAMGLQMEGFRMVRHVLLAALVSVIGVLTCVPQIRDFFLMALIGLCTDLLFQLVFFSAVLAIDIKRIELEEQWRRRQPIRPSLPLDHGDMGSGGQVEDNSFVFEFFRSRRLTSFLSVFGILFITVLYLESYQRGFYYQLIVTPVVDKLSSVFRFTQIPNSTDTYGAELDDTTFADHTVTTTTLTNSLPLASLWWRQLSRSHFQKLFNAAYGMSLTHRYLTILPPLDLHAHVPLELAEHLGLETPLKSSDPLMSRPPHERNADDLAEKSHYEPVSSQVLVVVLLVLSVSVIVNLTILILRCLRNRKKLSSRLLPSPSMFNLVTPFKPPSLVLRVVSVADLDTAIADLSLRLRLPPENPRKQSSGSVISDSTGGFSESEAGLLSVAYTSSGMLSIINVDSGDILCQIKPHPALAGVNRPDLVEQSFSVSPCWALAISKNLIFVSGGGGSAVGIFALSKEATTASKVKLSYLGTYFSTTSTAAVHSICDLPNNLFVIIFADGSIDIVAFVLTAATNSITFSSLYTMRMSAPVVIAVSNNLVAIGTADGHVRILLVQHRSVASIQHCCTINLPPVNSSSSNFNLSNHITDEITAIAIDSNDPCICAIGTQSGRLLLYELMPRQSPDGTMAASAKMIFLSTIPKPLSKRDFVMSSSAISPSVGLVNAVSRVVVDSNICLAVNASGSICIVNRIRSPPVVVGTLHANSSTPLSLPLAPVLEVAILPHVPASDGNSMASSMTAKSLFISTHSDGRLLLWAVCHEFSGSLSKIDAIAVAQSPSVSWPIEHLRIVSPESDYHPHLTNHTIQLAFTGHNKIFRVDIPFNISYAT